MPISLPMAERRDVSALGLSPRLGLALLASLCVAFALIYGLRPVGGAPMAAAHHEKNADLAPPTSMGGDDGDAGVRPAPLLRFLKLSAEDAFLKNASIPDSKVVDFPARPFYLAAAAPGDGGVASHCLAQAVYYEAASESLEGQRAVAQVVLNRVRDTRFPKTVCGVVFEGSGLRTGCQFSFTCNGSLARRPSAQAWLVAQAVADAALSGAVMKAIGHATHYHTVWVTPYWGPSLTKWGRLGSHIFYRWAGGGPPTPLGQYAASDVAPSPADASQVRAPEATATAPHAIAAMELRSTAAPIEKASVAPSILSARTTPIAVLALAVKTPDLSDAPYKATRPRGDLDSPHFASRAP